VKLNYTFTPKDTPTSLIMVGPQLAMHAECERIIPHTSLALKMSTWQTLGE